MAAKVVFETFSTLFLFIFISNAWLSFAAVDNEERCGCYGVCNKNFTTNSIQDIQKISACQRGCRFYSLVAHTSHDNNASKGLKARERCLTSCSESYMSAVEVSSCKFGCDAVDMSKGLCNTVEIQTPQFTYSFLIEESDVLIHPVESETDDVLTDPSLRKQIQKTLAALFDDSPKLPEIRFRNLPVKIEKAPSDTVIHSILTPVKCPKFYGLDSKFEFRNGKIIIGDLYLFVGVFIFVVLCFLLGHHIETKNIKRQLLESRLPKRDDFGDKEPLLKVDFNKNEIKMQKEKPPKYTPNKSEGLDPVPEQFDTKFEGITLVFHEEDVKKEKPADKVLKI